MRVLLTHCTGRESDSLRDADLSWPGLVKALVSVPRKVNAGPAISEPSPQMTYQCKLARIVIRPRSAIGSPSLVHAGAKRHLALT